MFERYTDKARRVIFFARYEASQFGSPYIETEHLLLGILRENRNLVNRFLQPDAIESIRKQVEDRTTVREKVSASIDLPLSHECKRTLAFSSEEAERLGYKHIGAEHLLLGILREEKCLGAEMLQERGLRLTTLREALGRKPVEETAASPGGTNHVPQIFNLPIGLQAELTRQAQARGIDMQAHLIALLDKAMQSPADAGASTDGLLEAYQRLRSRIAADGLPCLDAAQLEDEIARRKGLRP